MISILFAAATLTIQSVSQNPTTRTVAVDYTVSGEPAVVTLDAVTTNGAPMAATDLLNVAGDANRLVGVGMHRALWQPPAEAGFGPFDANAVQVSLKAWATNAPPDYMVIDLELPDRVRYYTSTNAIPGGVCDIRYKTDFLVMRRIPAAGVVWRMGSTTAVTPGSGGQYRAQEHTHYVKLTEDYYLAIYPTTFRQYYWMNNKSNGTNAFAPWNGDWDWPMGQLQYVVLRNWFHEPECAYMKDLQDKINDDKSYKSWPRDGHEIDAADTPKCSCKGPGTYTPTLRKARDRYGIEFDLPTDAQWEFACRAETGASLYSEKELRRNDYDAGVDELAWYRYNSTNEAYGCCLPHPVGLKKPNGYGLYDMYGNICEFCVDVYQEAPNTDAVVVDPIGNSAAPNYRGITCVIRGGTFDAYAKSCRSAMRLPLSREAANNSVYSADSKALTANFSNGFRLWAPCHAVK